MRCHFTTTFLERLLVHGARLAGVALPGPPSLAAPLRLTPPRGMLLLPTHGIDALAHHAETPLLQVGALRAEPTLTALWRLAPDVIVVACFPRRIPAAARDVAPLGALNVHPSLLPALRGPDPLFWTFREGVGSAGVTVHELVDRYDAGPLLAQAHVPWEDGATEHELEHRLATRGADLFVETVRALERGRASPIPQHEDAATYAPLPVRDDFALNPLRSARAAFNFVRGIAGRGVPIGARHDGEAVRIVEALGYANSDVRPETPAGAVALRCRHGWLIACVERRAAHHASLAQPE